MPDVERSIYFYKVEMAEDGGEWKRADVLRGLNALRGEDQVLTLGDDNYAWAIVDRIPRWNQTGRLRFFRDRRSNLPGFAHDFNPAELPIPEQAGLIEPTHVVLGTAGLIAAEYNHHGPRIPSHFASLLRQKLGLKLKIGTYVQGDILDQLDRLDYIRLLEFSVVPTPELQEELRNVGPIGDAAATLAEADDGRRLHLRLTAARESPGWTQQARDFVHRLLSSPGAQSEHSTKVLRVEGMDPATNADATVDLLKQKLVRQVDMQRTTQRSKVLDTGSTYAHIEEAMQEVRETDLPNARVLDA